MRPLGVSSAAGPLHDVRQPDRSEPTKSPVQLRHARFGDLLLGGTHEAELVLAPDDEEPGRDHHERTREHDLQRLVAEDQIAELSAQTIET